MKLIFKNSDNISKWAALVSAFAAVLAITASLWIHFSTIAPLEPFQKAIISTSD